VMVIELTCGSKQNSYGETSKHQAWPLFQVAHTQYTSKNQRYSMPCCTIFWCQPANDQQLFKAS
jgi:hypothetical protein